MPVTSFASARLRALRARSAGTLVLDKFKAFVSAHERDHHLDQPRDDRGRWTDGGNPEAGALAPLVELVARSRKRAVFEDDCEAQYARDTFHCTMVGLASCHKQAAARYSACLKGDPIPPLNY